MMPTAMQTSAASNAIANKERHILISVTNSSAVKKIGMVKLHKRTLVDLLACRSTIDTHFY